MQHRSQTELNLNQEAQARSSQRSRDNHQLDPLTPSPLKTRINLTYSRTKQREDQANELEDEDDDIRNFHDQMSEGRNLDNSPELRIRNQISEKQFEFGQYFVYTLERGYGDDPDSIVKYEVILEDD